VRGAFGPRLLVALSVRLYGGKPLQVRPGAAPKTLTYHGVVVTGGHDVEPVLYAAEPEVEPNYDRARDELETEVIDDALARGLPLLGICRGAQLLNVCRGGSLFQDLHSHRKKTSHRWTVLPLKTLCVDDKSRVLGCILGRSRLRINSLHNQAIDRLGEGLRVSGRDLDGIVQAIEDPKADFLLGVQWHPEFLIYVSRQRALFRALVRHARALSSSAGPAHPMD
jgi:putative glutamine amidotransferase